MHWHWPKNSRWPFIAERFVFYSVRIMARNVVPTGLSNSPIYRRISTQRAPGGTSPDVIAFFDLEKEAWRSCRATSIINIETDENI